jgi:molecular chaperone DnaK
MAEEAKCQLSTNDKYTIDVKIDGYDFVYTLTRDQLNRLEEDIFSSTIEKCRELLARNKFSSKDIEKVILIGGPTLSPHLRNMIEEGIGIPVDFSVDPLTAIVRGAAIYAAGRRIPDEVLEKIRENGNKKKEVSVHLHYPSTTIEEEVMVAGRIEPKRKGVVVSSEWGVEIKRVSKTGEMEWSNKIPVSEDGMFAMTGLPIKDYGENLFRLVVTDVQERIVDTHDFCIIKSPPLLLLPRGIGVADNNGNMVWFFKKGTPLPAEKTVVLKTNKALIKGEKGDCLNISVVEGNEAKVYLNRVIWILRVKFDILHTTIPEESDMEVTIKIDESRTTMVSAYFEEYDIEVYCECEMLMDLNIDYESLREELLKITVFLEEIKILEEDKSDAWKITDIERLISQAKDNSEYGQQAMDKILELRKKIAPILEKSNELIKYYSESYSTKGI